MVQLFFLLCCLLHSSAAAACGTSGGIPSDACKRACPALQKIGCDDATDSSTSTCNTVFHQASASSIVSGQQLSGQIDSGNVCANEATGFFYVKSNCTQSEDVTVTVSHLLKHLA